jgi:hypothetical protein
VKLPTLHTFYAIINGRDVSYGIYTYFLLCCLIYFAAALIIQCQRSCDQYLAFHNRKCEWINLPLSPILFQSTLCPYKHICSCLGENRLSKRRFLKNLVKKTSHLDLHVLPKYIFFLLEIVFFKDNFHFFNFN